MKFLKADELHRIAVVMLIICCVRISVQGQGNEIPVLDTHVHLWDLERPKGIYWIKPDNKILRRSMLPETHMPIARANNVKGVVVVQAGQHLPDNQWNLSVTSQHPQLYLGVVGNLSEVIGTAAFSPIFPKLCQDPRYVGYRLSGRYNEELTDDFFRDLVQTAESGKTVDILVGNYTLEDVAVIAKRLPDLKIVVDHFGGIQLSDQPLDPEWVQQYRALAEYQNVHCKVSALYGRFKQQPAPRTIDSYQPILDLTFECFGEDRIIYGSDWPVTRTTGDYASVVRLVREYFDNKGREVCEKLFYKNAMRFYGVEPADK